MNTKTLLAPSPELGLGCASLRQLVSLHANNGSMRIRLSSIYLCRLGTLKLFPTVGDVKESTQRFRKDFLAVNSKFYATRAFVSKILSVFKKLFAE